MQVIDSEGSQASEASYQPSQRTSEREVSVVVCVAGGSPGAGNIRSVQASSRGAMSISSEDGDLKAELVRLTEELRRVQGPVEAIDAFSIKPDISRLPSIEHVDMIYREYTAEAGVVLGLKQRLPQLPRCLFPTS